MIGKRMIGAALSALALTLAGCGGGGDADKEKVTFNMSWLPQGSMSGVIAAIDKGYYAEAGLDVNVVRGFGGGFGCGSFAAASAAFAWPASFSISASVCCSLALLPV